jgi:hypothetical protein
MGSCYSDPISDGSPLQWTATPGAVHYTGVDDAVRQPTAPTLTDNVITTQTNYIDTFGLSISGIPSGATVDSIVLWIYGSVNYNADDIYGSISVSGGSYATFQDFVVTTSAGWKSITFTGPWTSVSSLACQVKSSGANYGIDRLRRVFAVYAVINYTAAATGPAGLKTFNGLAKASIKTINGLAIASVKSVNGLT